MKLKRIMAMVLCFAMVLSTMSFNVFAEEAIIINSTEEFQAASDEATEENTIESDATTFEYTETTVATVDDVAYTDIQEAIVAAAPSRTVEIVDDVVVDEWIMFSQRLSIGSGQIITLDMDGLTINGNGHTLTVNSVESATNGNRLFHEADNLNIKNLTINYANEVVGGISLKSGELNGITINGGVGVLPGTGSITITDCTFNTNGSAIYNEEARDNLVVTGNTFNTAVGQYAIYLRGNTTFTNNTVVNGKVNVVSGSPVVTGNDFGNERFKVYNVATAKIENNKISNLEFKDDSKVKSTFGENTLSTEAKAALETAGVIYFIDNIDDLKAFRDAVNTGNTYAGKTVKLTADIDLSNEEWTPIGNAENKFQGIFNGDNHTISNLLVSGYNSNVGLFGFTTNGEVKNLTINNANVSGRLNVGVVAGTPYTSKYTNISVTGHVEVNGMSYVGGVGGKNVYANWTDITVDVDDTSYVKANSIENGTAYRTYIGGVIGFMGEGGHEVKNVTSNIDVIGSTCDIGGITGIAHYGNKFINCSSSGDIYLEDANENEIGGISGVWHNGGSPVLMENCSFTGSTYIAGEKVNAAISGPSYSVPNYDENKNVGELTIKSSVKLNGIEKESLAQAIAEANEMTEPAVIDLLGNNATLDKAYVINNDITFKNGLLLFDNYNGFDSDVYDPSGIYYAVMTIGANVTFDNVIVSGNNATASQGLFVLGTNGVISFENGSELNVKSPSATAVIYGEGTGKLVVNNAKLNIDGNGKDVRGMLAVEIDAIDAEITVKNTTESAIRNVNGTVDNSVINIDGAEYGIKNTDDGGVLTITDSEVTITNTANTNADAGIYLTNREKLENINSTISAKIVIEGIVLVPIIFETNGGDTIGVVEKIQGEVIDLSEYTPLKDGYNFVGWYSDEALTQKETSVTVNEPMTLYAKWEERKKHGGISSVVRYTLTFETNGGKAVNKITKSQNTEVDLSEYITEKEGYTFDGWYSDKDFTNVVTSVKLTKNTTVYAKWTEIEKEIESDEKGFFTDVTTDDWFYDNVKYVANNKLMNGVEEDKFAPDNTLTRAMLVTVLYRLEDEPKSENNSFTDVDKDAYYASAVSWAKENGIVNGVTENEFAPDSNITREQIASIIYRYAQFKGYDVSAAENTTTLDYDDAESISEYAVNAMKYAVCSGLINGKSATMLKPKDNATRAEIAAILHRFIETNNK